MQNKTNIVSLYQAGNGIYDLFDKVTVMAEGQVIYYGPRVDARPYFEQLGFVHLDGANTADFLTAVTALAERKVRPECQGQVPNTATEFAIAYRSSDVAKRMRAELDSHHASDLAALTSKATAARDTQKNKGVPASSTHMTTFGAQLKAALIKEYQQRWGDQW